MYLLHINMYETSVDTDRFANEFGGGLPERALTYIEGSNGTGKSVLSQRFMYGFLHNNYTVTYVSPQTDTRNFVQQLESLSYSVIDDLITEKTLNFKPVDVNTQKALFQQNKRDRSLLDVLTNEKCSDVWKSDIVIIDSLDVLLRNDPSFQQLIKNDRGKVAVRNFTQYLVDYTTNTDSSVIVTMNDKNIRDELLVPFRNESTVYIQLSDVELGGEVINKAKIVRYNLNEDDFSSEIMFRVQSGNGINIDKRSVA